MWASIMQLVDDTAEGRREKPDLIKNLSSEALMTRMLEKTRQDATVVNIDVTGLVDKVIAHRLNKLDSLVRLPAL
jgi:hypothetical protein